MTPALLVVFCVRCPWESVPMTEEDAGYRIDFDCPKCGADALDSRPLNRKEQEKLAP